MNASLFPYLVVSGTHRKIGQAIGETFKNQIQDIIKERKLHIPHYQETCALIGPYEKAARTQFPHLSEELKGMAEGSGVSYEDLFFYNTREIYDHSKIPDREYAQTIDHCTIAVSYNETGAIIGHNEDWNLENQNDLFILKATIGNTTFLGLEYIAYLPGCSATLNNWGLVQCVNELEQTAIVGVPKYFLARALSEAKTLDEATEIVKQTKRASGFNHVLVQGEEVRDFEIAYGDIDIEAQIQTPYIHTNHCISKRMRQYEEKDVEIHHANSYARYERAKILANIPMDVNDMHHLLADHQNQEYPICRHGAVTTIASVVIEPSKGEFYVGRGNPCHSNLVRYTI